MRIVYMGTPDIAVPTLRFLAESKHEVVGVLTQPDRPKGRGHHTIPTPVKAAALEYDIPVYQPLSLRKGEDAAAALETLRQLAPDLIVVLAYGQLLPKEVLELPKYRCINLHASLLPAYRGAAPIQWVILNGETKTGVTAQKMAEGLDTGDMLVKKEIAIGAEETAEELYERLSELCVETLSETLEQLEAGTLQGTPQDDAQSSYASRITKEMSALDFTRPAVELHNLIRGITGFTMLEGKRLKVMPMVVFVQLLEISDLLQRIFVGFNAGADKRLQQQSSFVVELFVELTRTVVRAGIGHDQELFTHKLLYIRTVI